MSDIIFHVEPDGQLSELAEAAYDSEAHIQELIAKYPSMLASTKDGTQGPTKLLLIARETALSPDYQTVGTWKIDHLFVDDKAVPTIVEVKQAKNSQIRREVVGQMLDYAANAALYWRAEWLRDLFIARCNNDGADPDQTLAEFLGDETTADDFWTTVKTNLQAGKIRLLFVADSIPPELRRVIEFLNTQMDPAEVLGIELRKFGQASTAVYVPKLIGATAGAEAKKVRKPPEEGPFDAAFFLAHGHDPKAVDAWSKYQDEIMTLSEVHGWNLQRNIVKSYVSFRQPAHKKVAVEISWIGSKSKLNIRFRMSEEQGKQFAANLGLPWQKFNTQWTMAQFKLWPEAIPINNYIPLIEASLQNT